MSRRGTSPVLGVSLLALLAVLGAAAVGAGALAQAPPDPPPRAAIAASADADAGRISLRHEGGDALAVGDLSLRVEIDGQPLAHQPPVPFFAARGFRAGPTGPFNLAADGTWTSGEVAAVRLAGTNEPALVEGARVTVTVFSGEFRVATATATAS